MTKWKAPRPQSDRVHEWLIPFARKRVVPSIPWILTGLLLVVIAIHPRNVSPDAESVVGSRFLSEEIGYRATVDELAELGAFQVRTLPAGRGLPRRQAVAFDEQALAIAEKEGRLCGEQHPSFFQPVQDWFASWTDSGNPTEQSACRQLIDDYRDSTFLGKDMERASRQTWLIAGDSISGIRRQAHAMRESGFDSIAANGKISYFSETRSPQNDWVLVNSASGKFETVFLQSKQGNSHCRIPDADQTIEAYCFRGGVVLVLPRVLDRQQVYSNGRPVTDPRGPGSDRMRVISIREGETLAFAEPGAVPGETWQLLKRRAALSQVSNGLRIRDPAFSGLASQIDTGLTTDLRSTIRRSLQEPVQRELEATLAKASSAAGSSLRGAITLMDGMTGQIAAAATFPSKREHLLPRDLERPERLIWLEQNQAFQALPVGSTAKVPFAFSIATGEPKLLGFKVSKTFPGNYNSVSFLRSGSLSNRSIHVRGPNYLDGRPRSDVTFDQALVQSDNVYAVSLIREAWWANRDAPQQADWLHNIRLISCSAPHYDRSAEACPVYLWGDDRTPTRGPAHRGVRFAFDQKKVEADPHNELFYGPLGNGSYNWSLVQLTQSYARILSGTTVSATLSAGAQSIQPLANHLRGTGYRQSRLAIMRALRGVIQRGTAKSLSDLERELGPGVYLYAKTGTPTVGYGSGKNGKVFILAAIRTATGRPPEEPGSGEICRIRFLSINLQFNTPATAVARQLVKKPDIRRWMTERCPNPRRRQV